MSKIVRPISLHHSELKPFKPIADNGLQDSAIKYNGIKIRANEEIIFRSIGAVIAGIFCIKAAVTLSKHLTVWLFDLADYLLIYTYEHDPKKFTQKLLDEINSLKPSSENAELTKLKTDVEKFLNSNPKANPSDGAKYWFFKDTFKKIKNAIHTCKMAEEDQLFTPSDKEPQAPSSGIENFKKTFPEIEMSGE